MLRELPAPYECLPRPFHARNSKFEKLSALPIVFQLSGMAHNLRNEIIIGLRSINRTVIALLVSCRGENACLQA